MSTDKICQLVDKFAQEIEEEEWALPLSKVKKEGPFQRVNRTLCGVCYRPMEGLKCSGCDQYQDWCKCDANPEEIEKGKHLQLLEWMANRPDPIEKIMELSERFLIKIAEQHYADQAPPNVKAKDLDWIDEETRREIKENGKNHEYKPFDKAHNPPGAIASEKTWDKAKKAVKKYWKKYDEPWAVVYHVYKNMGGKPKKKKGKKKK